MTFADRLDAALERVRTPALVGIDPHLDLLPPAFAVAREARAPRAERAAAVETFCKELIDLVSGTVAAVKPQSAFFEVLGADGAVAWERVVAHARAAGLLVIGDVKRSDIASTAAAYATAFLEGLPGTTHEHLCDAITLNPYLGSDSLVPFVDACKRANAGLFVLVRTSNEKSAEFQAHGEPRLCERVADVVHALGAELVGSSGYSSIGAVVGATHPEELERLRRRMPRAVLLLPGYGAQGASARDVRAAFPDARKRWRGALVNSSRGVAFAWREKQHANSSWQDASRFALEAMVGELRAALD
ncbi:MAG: orotidine-5'-phosphate decarboxylase [Planctomycetes bacterium]|nr:orotidine-5'-phosphate decarboxylase [Planctomycetota bacterium]